MIRYDPPRPRVALGAAALMMTAFTLGALVVLPSKVEADSETFGIVAVAEASPSVRCAAPALQCAHAHAMHEAAAATASASKSARQCDDQG
jgi:hypothetical protein